MLELSRTRLDLRGVPCPFNWVHTKLALEEMAEGEQLEVLLDDGAPICNVPRSARLEGHRIVQIEPEGEHYLMLVEKRGA